MQRRLQTLDVEEGLISLSGGNPGAVTAMLSGIEAISEIDPDNALGGLFVLGMLDDMGVYESDIWILFKDVGGQRPEHFLAVLRAYQLGLVGAKEVHGALRDPAEGTALTARIPNLVTEIQTKVPAFAAGYDQAH